MPHHPALHQRLVFLRLAALHHLQGQTHHQHQRLVEKPVLLLILRQGAVPQPPHLRVSGETVKIQRLDLAPKRVRISPNIELTKIALHDHRTPAALHPTDGGMDLATPNRRRLRKELQPARSPPQLIGAHPQVFS